LLATFAAVLAVIFVLSRGTPPPGTMELRDGKVTPRYALDRASTRRLLSASSLRTGDGMSLPT
jgi:hypothetical protein